MGGVVRNPNRRSFSQKRKDPDWTLWRQTATTRRLCVRVWLASAAVCRHHEYNYCNGTHQTRCTQTCSAGQMGVFHFEFRWCWIFFKGSLSLLGYCILFSRISTSLGHNIKCEVWFLSLTLNGKRSLVTAIKSPRVVLLLGAGWGGNDRQPLWKMTV